MRFHVGGLLFTSALVQGALVNRGDRSKLYAARKRKLARQSGEPIAAAAEEPVVRRNLRSLQGIGLKTLDAGALKKNKGKRRSDGKKNSDTTAAMDVPVGVTLSDTEVEYGTPVTATFDIKTADVSLDALQRINVTKSDDWEVCLYMRMQNNDDSILCLPADVKGEATVDEATGIPDLDMTAEVTLDNTSAETLPEALYGLGFDVYLQDENGVKIIGPGTFYLSPTAEMIAAADEEVSARETVHVVKGNHFKGKHYTSPIVAMKAHKVAKLTAAESPALAKAALDDKSYTLSTDKWAYYQTESVVVSYLRPDGGRGRGRSPQPEEEGQEQKQGHQGVPGGHQEHHDRRRDDSRHVVLRHGRDRDRVLVHHHGVYPARRPVRGRGRRRVARGRRGLRGAHRRRLGRQPLDHRGLRSHGESPGRKARTLRVAVVGRPGRNVGVQCVRTRGRAALRWAVRHQGAEREWGWHRRACHLQGRRGGGGREVVS
mmetsp:Transcript_28911/g.64780  ORF Transcript_28911/g.64780 Transcript_28911/m.64780 type:complete len:487 (+) Transcript_28911:146-1606(+)